MVVLKRKEHCCLSDCWQFCCCVASAKTDHQLNQSLSTMSHALHQNLQSWFSPIYADVIHVFPSPPSLPTLYTKAFINAHVHNYVVFSSTSLGDQLNKKKGNCNALPNHVVPHVSLYSSWRTAPLHIPVYSHLSPLAFFWKPVMSSSSILFFYSQ